MPGGGPVTKLGKRRNLPDATRDRLVRLLRESSRPVEELADALGITPNAVRSQLTILERDGLVQAVGERRGPRRPSRTYGVTSEAERLLSLASAPVLRAVLETLAAARSEEEVEGILREAGERMAVGVGLPLGDRTARAERTLQTLADLGAWAELREEDGRVMIHGHGCLLAEAVEAEPRACKLMEAFLSKMLGAPVRERCERGERLRCAFEVLAAGEERVADEQSPLGGHGAT